MKIDCEDCGQKYEAGFVGIPGSNKCPECFKKLCKKGYGY